MKTLILAALIAASIPAAAAAKADDVDAGSGALRMTVSLADLDLARSTGANTALARIGRAAELVCGAKPARLDLGGAHVWQMCVHSAIGDAVRKVGSPLVTARYFRAVDSRELAAN